jgi:hypothetical protein
MPGAAKTTIGPGLSANERSNVYKEKNFLYLQAKAIG